MTPQPTEAAAGREATEPSRGIAPASVAGGRIDGGGADAARSLKRSEGEGRPAGQSPAGRCTVPSTIEVAFGHSIIMQVRATGGGERPSGRERAGSVKRSCRGSSIECNSVLHVFSCYDARTCIRSLARPFGLIERALREAVERPYRQLRSSSRRRCARSTSCSTTSHILLLVGTVGTTLTTSRCTAGLDNRRGPPARSPGGARSTFEVFDV